MAYYWSLDAGEPAGTAGIHLLDEQTAELNRMFILPAMRGKGGAQLLSAAAEQHARALGAARIILDTRLDLVEARALYARLGYAESPPHNDQMYAECWYQKRL
ncbi:GNAT family N-acetyltransferase [Nocardia sp. NPDC006044]|uniref:GNAT family N-acetyltransferase n=1 Tax=Nocardia sp. NPDC006044 TaxID=3364306 RepID=UPI0036AC77AC